VESRIAIAITGASGAIYATRTLAALLSRGVHVELVVSDYGRRLLRDELGEKASVEQLIPFLASKYGPEVAEGTLTLHGNRDLGATIASGSHKCAGMAIVPCSMKTLAGGARAVAQSCRTRRRRDAQRAASARPTRDAHEPAAAQHGALRRKSARTSSGDARVLTAAENARRPQTSWPGKS
jgi:3-polyprenyl-4-hydroxybenzoate decarboxylase